MGLVGIFWVWGGGGLPVEFVVGWGKWLDLVGVGRENGFVWYFLVWRRRGLGGRELHAGPIVERGNGVAGGRGFVFNGNGRNVGVTGGRRLLRHFVVRQMSQCLMNA